MKKLQFSVCRGDEYKKVAESQFTFKFLCSMKSFLLHLMGNECFKDRLVLHFQRVLPLLSEPESSLIGQLNIDRNLVEVQNGWFWSFSEGAFVQGVIPESEVKAYVFISKGCLIPLSQFPWLQFICWLKWQCICSIEKSFFYYYTT